MGQNEKKVYIHFAKKLLVLDISFFNMNVDFENGSNDRFQTRRQI